MEIRAGARKVRQRESVVTTRREGEAFLLDMDGGTYFTLNAVGDAVWSTMGSDGATLHEIVQALQVQFDVEPERAETDATAFVAQLVDLSLVTLV